MCRGFAGEWADAIAAIGLGGGPVPFKETAVFLYVPWAYKFLADRLVTGEPNLTPLLHCSVTDVARTGSTIDAVVVGSKRGPLAVTGSVFVDASGDADVVHHAGLATDLGGPGQRQFPSMQFLMQDVDVAAAYAAGLDKLNKLLQTTGREWGLSRTGGAVLPTPRKGEVYGAMTRIGVDGHSPDMTDPFEATAAEIAGRAEAEKAGRFLIENMPGFEHAYFADTPTQLGVRETRRARGDYELTGDDVLGAARFDDAIACGAWPQEFHVAGTETQYVWLDEGAYYQVPYRSLLVQGVDNLLVAGRCISATHEALASSRVTGRLSVLANGERAPRPSRLFAGDGAAAMTVFDELSRHPFDYVIVDGPPLLGVVDAQMVAQLADTVIVVGRLDRLTVENANDLRELLDRHEINALGLFVVGAQWGESHYYLAEREAVLDEA